MFEQKYHLYNIVSPVLSPFDKKNQKKLLGDQVFPSGTSKTMHRKSYFLKPDFEHGHSIRAELEGAS